MIGFLTGRVLSQNQSALVVEAGGVGYEVQVSKTALEVLSQKKGPVSVWVHTAFRQDSLELYGFTSKEEKELFLALLKVKGMGGRMALSVLGSCSLERLVDLIQKEDVKALTALPRVGRKTAQQIVLTLKDQVSDTLIDSQAPSLSLPSEQITRALSGLGFNNAEIQEAVKQIKWQNDLKQNLRQALNYLSAR